MTQTNRKPKRKPKPVPNEIIVLRLLDNVKGLVGVIEKLTDRVEILKWDIHRLRREFLKRGPR